MQWNLSKNCVISFLLIEDLNGQVPHALNLHSVRVSLNLGVGKTSVEMLETSGGKVKTSVEMLETSGGKVEEEELDTRKSSKNSFPS